MQSDTGGPEEPATTRRTVTGIATSYRSKLDNWQRKVETLRGLRSSFLGSSEWRVRMMTMHGEILSAVVELNVATEQLGRGIADHSVVQDIRTALLQLSDDLSMLLA